MSGKPLLLVRYRLAGGLMDEVLERCDVRFLDGPVLPPTSAEDLVRTWGIWTFGERIDVALDGEGAREARVFLDFAERGGDAVLPLGGLDKIEDLLLAFSEGFAHGVFT